MPTVLVAADADWIHDEVRAALGGSDTTMVLVRAGRDVAGAVAEHAPDLAVVDLQIGNMGGMATTLNLKLEAEAGRLPDVPVLMLLDRSPDIYLYRRSAAQGFLLKPVDAFRLRKAGRALMAGGTYEDPVEHWGTAEYG